MTSFFVQVWTLPQWVHVNFCVFTLAVCQCFSSIVCPVSVSFDVEGQRTSKLLMLGPFLGFDRRGGSNKNLVAMSESINDARLGGIVRRHFHSHAVANRQANKTLAHLSRDMREDQTFVCERHAKHGPGEHHHNSALQLDRFLRIHDAVFQVGAIDLNRPLTFVLLPPALPTVARKRAPSPSAVRTRTFFAWTRFINS
jgi:hypothetical protein